jgi:hypothetical protein
MPTVPPDDNSHLSLHGTKLNLRFILYIMMRNQPRETEAQFPELQASKRKKRSTRKQKTRQRERKSKSK